MDPELFVENIKRRCAIVGVPSTVACREAGVGTSFINNIEKGGSIPSVEKVMRLAAYLGVTTSELLGERREPTVLDSELIKAAHMFMALSPERRKELIRYMKYLDQKN